MSLKNFDKEKLISLVRLKRAIWDKSHPHHFNKGILHKHWQAIATELKCPEGIVKRQWKYLRQEFGRQLKRAATAAIVAPEEEDITSWPHYYSMLFVIDQFTSRSADENALEEAQGSLLTPKIEVDSSAESDDDPDLPKSLLQVETASSADGSEQNAALQWKRQVMLPPPDLKHTSSQTLHQLSITERPQKSHTSEYQRDDDVAFFDSILPHVKSLKMDKKFQFRMHVQKLLYDMLFPPPNTEESHKKSPEEGYLARIVPIQK